MFERLARVPNLGIPEFCSVAQYPTKEHTSTVNSYDCGVFVYMYIYALYLAKNAVFDFTQDDMPSIRRHITFRLL